MVGHEAKVSRIRGSLLALLACLCLTGCKDNKEEKLRAEQIERLRQNEERLLGYETQRAQLTAQLADIKRQALIRLASNKLAAAALVAAGGGAVGALSDKLSDNQRVAAGAIGLLGAGYCLANASECHSLTVDIAKFVSTIESLDQQIAALTQSAGHRIHVRNKCATSLTIAVAHDAPIAGPFRFGWWTIEPQTTARLELGSGVYLRTTGPKVQYHLRNPSAGEDVDLSTLTMKEALVTIDSDHNAIMETTC